MNLLLVKEAERIGESIVVSGQRATHLREVLRSKVGDRIKVGFVRNSIGTAQVMAMDTTHVTLGAVRQAPVNNTPKLRLIIALPRPKALGRLLQTAACFGVAHIDLINAWRVSKSYWHSEVLADEGLQEHLWLGCEQGGHVWLPTIATHRFLLPFFDSFEANHNRCLLAHPGNSNWLSAPQSPQQSTTIAIGPEGGWIPSELASFSDAGFQQICISNAILRSEIALAAVLSQYQLLSAHSMGNKSLEIP